MPEVNHGSHCKMCGYVNRYVTDTICGNCFAPVVCNVAAIPEIKRTLFTFESMVGRYWGLNQRGEL